MNDYEERKQARIDRYREKAEKARQQSSQLSHESVSMLEHIPPGQPILVGHHSERGHRKLLERSDRKMEQSIAASEKADYYEHTQNIPQLNRAIKYVPYVSSRAAGAPRGSSPKGGAGREDRASNTSAASSHKAKAVGHDTHTGMMILALTTRHRVERPATRMGGGTLNPMERPCPSPFEMPLTYDCEPENPHRSTVRILSYQRRHRFCKG